VSGGTTAPPIRFARRVTEIQVSPTLAVMNRASDLIARGVDIIDLGPGEPDFATPASVSAAGQKAIADGHTKYTNVLGSIELRKAIAERYNSQYGTRVELQNIIAGTGGKQELFNLVLALVADGDEVVISSPYWVSFPDQVSFAGGKPVFAPTDRANHFRPTLESIASATTSLTRGVILNSPCNPTGAVISENELGKIVEFCHGRELFLIFDETYEFFVYEGKRHVSAIRWFDEFPETVIVVNSLSKTFAMTGWRLGYAVAHPSIISAAGKIQSHSTSNPSSISQVAAINALKGDDSEVRRMYEAYEQRRLWLLPAINSIEGFHCEAPDGAFYIFPDVKALYGRGGVSDSTSLTAYLLDRAHVAVVPGIAFGDDDSIRISYATALDRLKEGVRRIGEAVAALK
jgi:aspartate aminotransferase